MKRSLESQFERYRQRGDVAALADVFDRTATEVLRIATHFAPTVADAEELLQETFLTAIRSAETFDASRKLVPWLLGILHNHARNAGRRARRQPVSHPEPDSLARIATAAAAPVELPQAVARAANELEEPYRAVLVLHLTHGLRAASIADVLGRPPATVRSQLARGLKRIRERLPKSAALPAIAAAPLGRGIAGVREVVVKEACALALATPVAGTAALVLGGLFVTQKTLTLAIILVTIAAVGVGTSLYCGAGEEDPVVTADEGASLRARAPDAPGAALEPTPGKTAPNTEETETPAPIVPSPSVAVGGRVPLDAPIPEGKGSVAGRIRFPDGKPLVGVRVALWGESPITDVTDEDGAFHLHGDWVATRQVYIKGEGKFDAVVLKAVEMKVNERVDVEIVVEPGHTLDGRVRSAADDAPIVNNLIVLRRPGATGDDATQAGYASFHTDAEGRFHFAYLPAGRYSLTVLEDGFEGHRQMLDIGPNMPDIDLRLVPSRQWDVRWTGVPDAAQGTVVGWRLYREGPGSGLGGSGRATLGERGAMQLDAPAPGRYKLILFATKYTQRVEQVVDIPAGALAPLELTVELRVHVTGRLVDANRRPLKGVKLFVGPTTSSPTDAEGGFEVATPLEPGTHLVWAYAGRSGVRLPSLALEEPGSKHVELTMPGTARLRARIGSEDTQYLSGWLMKSDAAFQQVAYIRLEDDKRIALAHLAPGGYQLQLSMPGRQSIRRDVQLAAGETLDLGTLEFPRYPVVPVSFVVPAGAKAPDPMWVRIHIRDAGDRKASSDGPHLRKEKGRLVLFGLMPGRYDVTFTPPGFEAIERHITITAGTNPPVVLELRKP